MHPGCHGLPHALLEGETEGAVTSVAAIVSKLLGNDGLPCRDSLAIEIHEMVDAQIVDISIVRDALT